MKFVSYIKLFAVLCFIVILASCEKDARVKPDLSFATDQGYISGNTTLKQDSTFKVKVKVKKTEDDLKTYNVTVSYDGGKAANKVNRTLSGSEQGGFESEESFTTRHQAGTEKYTFTVTDKDGNIASSDITVTVQ